MPLMKRSSKKALEHNIRTEIHAHPDNRKQDLAIAFSIQREAKKKKKASGGTVESGSRDMNMAEGGDVNQDRLFKRYTIEHEHKTPEEHKAREENLQNEAALDIHPDLKKARLKKAAWHKSMYAEGGSISASNEKRPMPNDLHDDAMMERQNRGNKAPRDDSWTDTPTERQAKANDVRGKKLPIKRPRMVPSDVFSTRMYDEEGNLEESARPGPYAKEPDSWMDEDEAKKMGKSPDMASEHSTGRKPYAKGGEKMAKGGRISDQEIRQQRQERDEKELGPTGTTEHWSFEGKKTPIGKMSRERQLNKYIQSKGPNIKGLARGGEVESSDYDHPENEYEQDLNSLTPSMDEGDEMAMSHNEMDADMEGKGPDMAEPHNEDQDSAYADGGEIGRSPDDSEDQPEHEAEEEHHNSIAAAIMARRNRLHAEIDSGAHDLDSAVRMADGGEILSHDSIYSDNSDQADLSRNHDEDANEEDQLSFNALRKENYNDSDLDVENPKDSAEMGDEEEHDSENKHDMVSSIRKRMKSRRQF